MSTMPLVGAVPEVIPAVADPRFDAIAALTRRLLRVPIATVSIITTDEHRLPGLAMDGDEFEDARSVPLSNSICRHVVEQRAPLVLADTRSDPRLASVPSVAQHRVLAYAGIPLADLDGEPVGTLCVNDDRPREWTQDELDLVSELAALCASELQLRQAAAREAVAEDRDRIARDLHSTVFAELLSLSMVLAGLLSVSSGDAADLSRTAIDTVDGVLKSIRRTIFDRAGSP